MSIATAVVLVLCCSISSSVSGQEGYYAAGVTVGSVPRALQPLCSGARTLRGVGLAAKAGISTRRFALGATVDYFNRLGVHDVAGCVPRSGVAVDSSYAPAGTSASLLAVTATMHVGPVLRAGGEIGKVIGQPSWFAGLPVSVQYRRMGFEFTARRHLIRFDEVTRDYGSGTTREISRMRKAELSWGYAARVMLAL